MKMKGGLKDGPSQFKAFIRFVLDALKDFRDEPDGAKKAANKIIENLQKTLED